MGWTKEQVDEHIANIPAGPGRAEELDLIGKVWDADTAAEATEDKK